MLIENKIVFIKTPKNASSSIYKSLVLNNFNVEEGNPYVNLERTKSINRWKQEDYPLLLDNYHHTYGELIKYFSPRDYLYVGVKRDSTDRFISAWKYMIRQMMVNTDIYKTYNLSPFDFSDFNSKEVIDFFKPIMGALYSANNEEVRDVIREFFCSDESELINSGWRQIIRNFQSQYYWGIGNCDLIFNYEELDLFEKYIMNEFNKDFKLLHINSTLEIDVKLEKTKELIEFVEKHIDSPFKIKKML